MRAVWLFAIVIAGCTSESQLVLKPLPPLAPPVPPLIELVDGPLGFSPGEHLIWEVQARGMAIGRLELDVADDAITSKFATNRVVSAFAKVDHELITLLDQGAPVSSSERLDFDGELRQTTVNLSHSKLHSLHTALGLIRAWAHDGAHPGFASVAFMDQRFKLQLEQPATDGDLLRVDAHITGDDTSIGITMWLDAEHRPVRIEIRANDERVTAELIAS
ncbi:MAG TPA: hypothetical protein VMZ53_01580 [Kofleriaceae bacterium]|nr:hypothetical protein [Kofleriaceae bacterium]